MHSYRTGRFELISLHANRSLGNAEGHGKVSSVVPMVDCRVANIVKKI